VKATALNGYILSGLGSINDKPMAKEVTEKGLIQGKNDEKRPILAQNLRKSVNCEVAKNQQHTRISH
jgi:hypothetical protein